MMPAPSFVPPFSGGLDAYEYYVFIVIRFLCSDCGAELDCPFTEEDADAGGDAWPGGIWMERHALRARDGGWYVHPLSAEGSLTAVCFCPACTSRRGLTIAAFPVSHPAA